MLVREDRGSAISNRINRLFPEHFIWINSQLKRRVYMATRGREVLIKIPGSSSTNIVNIPLKKDPGYFEAWVKVYNYALDYLEGSLNLACMENKFIRQSNGEWFINGHVIVWPKFNFENADYAKALDKILSEYNYIKANYLSSLRKENSGIKVQLSSVKLKPANDSSKTLEEVPAASEEEKFLIQKISDGDLLNTRDISSLRESGTDIVVLTCKNVMEPREEDLFLKNFGKCRAEGFNTGVFIYGRATDEHSGASELKRILKLIGGGSSNFSGLIIYSIDNDYVLANKDSDLKLLDFISMYNSIANALRQMGYFAMISMDLKSGKVIDDINRRYNMQNEHEIIYMVVVRDVSDLEDNASSIVVDPGNDYDVVSIKNKDFLKKICNKSGQGLAKAA
ncbi:MAG: hypothetical protein IKF82_06620 [Bacilli bacterium]|nr:hypothetical protein [Bacilli bacterium]